MEVSTEAKRIMVVALGKLYSSRSQRGGLRLHRSLLLTLLMRSARDIYHAAQAHCEDMTTAPTAAPVEPRAPAAHVAAQPRTSPREEVVVSPAETETERRTGTCNKENLCPTGPSRKRRGTAAAEPDFLPCKKAKLEQGTSHQQLAVSSVLIDYVNCSSELGASTHSVPLQRVIAVC